METKNGSQLKARNVGWQALSAKEILRDMKFQPNCLKLHKPRNYISVRIKCHEHVTQIWDALSHHNKTMQILSSKSKREAQNTGEPNDQGCRDFHNSCCILTYTAGATGYHHQKGIPSVTCQGC